MKTIVEKYAFDTSRNPPEYCNHLFTKSGDTLEHYTDGALRAQVNELHVMDYLSSKNIAPILSENEINTVLQEFSDL